MEQPSSSSKVTVEYFDPYGVYPLLSPGLLPRLPLRNLHWESHSGPLRSISSLHIDLISTPHVLSPLSTTDVSFRPEFPRVRSEDSATSRDDGFQTQILGNPAGEILDTPTGPPRSAVTRRRHQIPGLRQTPYLKVFFLRCDDDSAYKSNARRQVREWIKECTPPTQSTTKLSAQENHDAFEWLVVHVIVPNTAAATQPRSSTDNGSGAGWRGGSSPTILDKLRADFNGSSKSATDHIAQIRIGVNDVPYEMLPRVVPAIPGSYTETAQENVEAWADLISKFKELILASFDLRVSQYEEDIRERDAQRTLPGWNFCTFFVLKEGLARGFESVGLVEDALVGYDELAVGLDAVVREQTLTSSGPAHGGLFLPYTEDLKRLVEKSKSAILKDTRTENGVANFEEPIDLQSSGDTSDSDIDEIPLNAAKKRYRELILANNISIFDFRCYVFARQLSLLLRLANASSSQEELLAKLKEQRESSLQGVATRFPTSQPSEDAENLAMLGEICRRSMDFIASISNIIRDDIWASQMSFLSDNEDKEQPHALQNDSLVARIVDNIVSSFTFSVAQQILAQTSTKALPIPPSTLAPPSSKISIDGQEPKAAIPEPKTMMHPARSSSLAIRSPSREPSSPGTSPSGRRSSVPDRQSERGSVSSTFLKAGLEELAAHRAGLYLLSRNVLEQVGSDRSWSVGWREVTKLQYNGAEHMDEVDLNDEKESQSSSSSSLHSLTSSILHGIQSKLLRVALDNKDDYYRLYETLTDKALRHFKVASHTQSALATMADLAVLKFYLKDFAAAASYFYQITPSYNEAGWMQIELSMLVMYAESLKQLQRKDEYIRVVLKLLSKAAMAENARRLTKSTVLFSYNQISHEEIVPREPYLEELLQITSTLDRNVQVPLSNFFSHVEVVDTPRYHPEQDSFALTIKLSYLLSESFTIDKARVRIGAITGDANREIWLESDGPTKCDYGKVQVHVRSNSIIPGAYTVNHVSLYASNIILKYEHGNLSQAIEKHDRFLRCPKFLIHQQADALDVKLYASKYMHLDRNRSLEIELSSGWNNVQKGELHVRAATAGLRLQTSEAKLVKGTLELSKKAEAGVLAFGAMGRGSVAKIRIPFNLEQEVDEISLRLETSYTTERGDFLFANTPRLSIMLPLGVNVQDVFKHKALFSRFTISSATSSPLRLLSSRLESSEVFQAESGTGLTKSVVIFPRQPASMLYKITKVSSETMSPKARKAKSSLSLILHYITLEEEIDNAITLALHQSLRNTPLYSYIRLVIPLVLSELRAQMSPEDIERTAILHEVSTAALANARWKEHLNGLGRLPDGNADSSNLLVGQLLKWQQENPVVPLLPISLDDATIDDSRSIIIPVDVPPVTVVHTADLRLPRSLSTDIVLPSMQPISALLRIKWTRIWGSDVQSPPVTSNESSKLEFIYELSGPADTWLIGGRRKGHFKLPLDSQESTSDLCFTVILIPLREGFLPYPSLEIRPAPVIKIIQPGPSSSQGAAPPSEAALTCETDYRNSGETIRVISDARKTTVSLDASGPQGGAWLLESERRGGGIEETALG
ncbi:TMEM1 family protein-like protein [Bisporella sp. PMI_857]|nr:TMEM1 family protein-like protein [Bisporella sp. PMI_857]